LNSQKEKGQQSKVESKNAMGVRSERQRRTGGLENKDSRRGKKWYGKGGGNFVKLG